ncbi:uncharacterized protein LOC131519634 [Neofelis nebulosa]|uniref:uncharacterized protein LOC131519634 n=1 Tax=Neofelis nebulosa TaxID=61452 RepID=UPI00272BE9AC|nr:uncharacterized protein LOC131519634 [Neofelis nebulosa]
MIVGIRGTRLTYPMCNPTAERRSPGSDSLYSGVAKFSRKSTSLGGQPTANLDLINAAFPLTRPPQDGWDYNTAEDPDLDTPLHDCAEILAQVHGVREDLQDHPLPDAEVTWFTDSSSFIHQGQRYAGAAVTTETETVWAEHLPAGTSAQWPELVALTKALTLGKDKRLNVYTGSRYAFATAHIHGDIYRERGLLTAEGKTIKNKEEILALLKALWLPKRLAIIHCPGHQKPITPVATENNLADQVAREVALQVNCALMTTLPDPGSASLPENPAYTKEDLNWIQKLPLTQCLNGWWRAADCSIILPEEMGNKVLSKMHRATHMGTRKMQDLIRHARITIRDSRTKIEQIVASCKACQLTNATNHGKNPGSRTRGTRPGDYWEIDFTEVKPGKYGYKYLLVFIDTSSGWTEAFPTKHETAQVVAKKMLEDIMPRYGFPTLIGSDNGPAFISKVIQGIAQFIGADWKLHCAYRPQSSGQVERMNRTLKETLTKLTMETGANWVVLLPYALFRVQNSPYKLGLTPFEIMYGVPPPIIPNLQSNVLTEFDDHKLLISLRELQHTHQKVWPRLRAIYENGPPPEPHHYRPGDWVYVRRHKQETLQPWWKGPYGVILTTPTALKVDGIATWIHYTHARPADPFAV